jgi:hypothetical protein
MRRGCGAQGRCAASRAIHAAVGRCPRHVPVEGMTGGTDAFRHCNPRMQRRIHCCVESPNHEEAVMYSMQHVFWRGAMALSLLVVGGIGAGVSEAPLEAAQACPSAATPARTLPATAMREVALQQARIRDRAMREGA